MRNLLPSFNVRLVLCCAVLFVAGHATSTPAAADSDPRSAAVSLTGAAMVHNGAFDFARELSDRVGARLAGSAGADRAVDWAMKAMQRAGLSNVRKEPVRVPRWIRGEESAELLTPATQPLKVAALGNSVGTPAGGLDAEVVEVTSLDELGKPDAPPAHPERFAGRIVFFNQPMRRSTDFSGYAEAVPQRSRGHLLAARAGAVAVLVRSIGTGQTRLPHTGAMRIEPNVTRIPAAALAVEDAELLHRFIAAGESVRVRLRLGAHDEGEVDSWNVVGDVIGRELPKEIVLIGAHLDAWDLGTGALDDGAGCGMVLETARLLLRPGLRPRRTVRVVLFMNEELGLSGARAYAVTHKDELSRHVAALEADSGAGLPIGYRVAGGEPSRALLRKWAAPLEHLVPMKINSVEEVGADLIPLQAAGVPVLSVDQDVSDYFDWHHSAGDSIDKINPHHLALATAAFASLTFYTADSQVRLPASPPPAKR